MKGVTLEQNRKNLAVRCRPCIRPHLAANVCGPVSGSLSLSALFWRGDTLAQSCEGIKSWLANDKILYLSKLKVYLLCAWQPLGRGSKGSACRSMAGCACSGRVYKIFG